MKYLLNSVYRAFLKHVLNHEWNVCVEPSPFSHLSKEVYDLSQYNLLSSIVF